MPRSVHASAVLLSVLLVAAVGVGFSTATEHQTDERVSIVASENATNYLSPPSDEVTREEYANATLEVGTAVAVDTQALHARHDQLVFDQQFQRAESEEERVAIVRERADTIETQLGTLDRRHERLLEAYSDGQLTTEELLYHTVRIDAMAQRQRSVMDHARTTASNTPQTSVPFSLEVRFVGLASELVLIPSPVAEPVGTAIDGEADPQTVYVQASDDALVLATLEEDTYLREAVLRNERVPDAPDQFEESDQAAILAAFERGGQLYPWVFENALGDPSIRSFGDSSVYLIEADHPQGRLVTYLDGATTNAFREHHHNQPGAIPVSGTTSATDSGLEVTVETTAPTGPMRVSVTDGSGEPVPADVAVDGQRVDSTDGNGQLWTVQPTGSFEVTATGPDGGTVSVRTSD